MSLSTNISVSLASKKFFVSSTSDNCDRTNQRFVLYAPIDCRAAESQNISIISFINFQNVQTMEPTVRDVFCLPQISNCFVSRVDRLKRTLHSSGHHGVLALKYYIPLVCLIIKKTTLVPVFLCIILIKPKCNKLEKYESNESNRDFVKTTQPDSKTTEQTEQN